jgi:NTE family protein
MGDRMIELHGQDWPEEDLWITTVRVDDGQRVVFGLDRTDVDVGTAVEASSAIPGFFQPVWIEQNKYLDGGVHSPVNADLLEGRGLDLIVVVAPMSLDDASGAVRTLNGPVRMFWRTQIRAEIEALREAGENVLLVEPTLAEAKSMGPTMMDPTRIVNVVMQTTSAARAAMAENQVAEQLAILRSAGGNDGRD